MIKMDDIVEMKAEAELTDKLQKSLKGKRYLIVLDDMWKSEAWDAVRLCFPSESKGSGILLTTRNTEVARDAGTENLSLQMGFMDQDESWNLFKIAASANEALSYEFETIGKQIADECHGLPLTIVVVAGLLKSKGAIEDWTSVAKDVKSLVTNDPDKRCSRVLGLSYNHLTSDLKTCLLHFGVFPEDSEIPVKNLMRSWMAEWFLKLENDLEREAEKIYLPDCPSGPDDKGRHLDFSNLQTISYLSLDCCTKEVIMRIQNVKELGINGYGIPSNGLLNNLVHLQQLETLSFILCFNLLPAKAFPATLKKLKLERTFLHWSYLDIITELPNLEVLLIEDCFLKYWKATNDSFPVLELLMIRSCRNLKEIPIEFADIHTLQLIELRECLPKLAESAALIQKEQAELGNNPVDVRISDQYVKSFAIDDPDDNVYMWINRSSLLYSSLETRADNLSDGMSQFT
ncbi:hypothetical protein CQW23_06849 [Capsicum baccatum]|uniref:NB-ARC domain-containing protein n=1 Tax=Capsicum baccatum TaxID=33114 RepID=A0A2G2X4J1_CAPBA|nr:hypothetical protein CQW23_06849 [Capsicum baccatum]